MSPHYHLVRGVFQIGNWWVAEEDKQVDDDFHPFALDEHGAGTHMWMMGVQAIVFSILTII